MWNIYIYNENICLNLLYRFLSLYAVSVNTISVNTINLFFICPSIDADKISVSPQFPESVNTYFFLSCKRCQSLKNKRKRKWWWWKRNNNKRRRFFFTILQTTFDRIKTSMNASLPRFRNRISYCSKIYTIRKKKYIVNIFLK